MRKRVNWTKFAKKIVVQHRVADEKKIAYKEKAKLYCRLIGLVILITFVSVLFWCKLQHHSESIYAEVSWFWHNNYFAIFIAALLIDWVLYQIFHRIEVYHYFYTTKFPFKVIPSIYAEKMRSLTSDLDPFVHSKIYIIDSRNIFIGSANLTHAGLKHNIESFVKISTQQAVRDMITEIDSYLTKHCNPININILGANLYYEALY